MKTSNDANARDTNNTTRIAHKHLCYPNHCIVSLLLTLHKRIKWHLTKTRKWVQRDEWTQPVEARSQIEVSQSTVPSRAGRNDDSDRHGILDFFLVTIGSSSDLVCNMGTWDTAGRPRATLLRLPTNVSMYRHFDKVHSIVELTTFPKYFYLHLINSGSFYILDMKG